MLDLRPLRSAEFLHLAFGYWVNEFGTWVGEIALTILVFDRTHSALGTAALFLAMRFAPALFAPFLTATAEAMTLRVVLPTFYVLEAGLFACIAVLAQHIWLPAILGLAVLDGVLAITAKALTRSATAAGLMKQGLLREGNGILNFGVMASTACAPLIAGVLVAWKGPASALLIDAGTFLMTALIVVTARGIHVDSDVAAGLQGRLRAGVDAVRHRAPVRRLLVTVSLAMLLSALPIPVEVVFAKRTLGAGDFGYGLMLASWGAGMVIGAGAFTVLNEVRLMKILAVGALLNAVGYSGLAAAPSLLVACVASAIGGVGNGAAWISAVTAIQERVSAQTQSSVMTVLEGLNQLMPAVGFVLGGVITAMTSPRIAYAAAGVGVAAVVVVAATRPPDRVGLRNVETSLHTAPTRAVPPGTQENPPPARTSTLPTLNIG
jgi:hypothetical protein